MAVLSHTKRGRTAEDGADIVYRKTHAIALDEPSFKLVQEFGAGNVSLALRRMSALLNSYRAGVSANCEDDEFDNPRRKLLSQDEWINEKF